MNNQHQKINIAIDGYSSTGKSTVAKQLAKTLNYIYVDTGAMYRAVTLFVIQKEIKNDANIIDKQSLIEQLPNINLSFKYNTETCQSEIYLNNQNVEKQIRTLEISNLVSEVAAIPQVRQFLVQQQQAMGKDKGVIMDGRDIGSVVFPKAELKIFLVADAKVRAERRFLELQNKQEQVSFDEVYQNILDRDYKDCTREESPLTKVSDAVEMDVTHIGRKEQFGKIYNLTLKKINNH